MKKIVILLFIFWINSFSQTFFIKGKIVDAETGIPLVDANVTVKGEKLFGAISDSEGFFLLSGVFKVDDVVEISFVGYEKLSRTISTFRQSPETNLIKLVPAVISSQSVLIKAFRRKQEITPINYSSLERQKLNDNYTLQDIPEFLSYLPSSMFYSESGNGIGYNYLSIRGFDQRRISVAINGVPQNDPEDHNVYWLDFPDLISSVDFIQVQRGSGAGIVGYPAIGGSINIITTSFANEPKLQLLASIGSYNTRKYGAEFSSGLIDQKYSFYTKLSRTLSGGYREKSWVKFNSFHFSVVRYDKNLTSQINIYGGPIADGLAYNGLPKFAIIDKDLRRKNYSYWETDESNKKITYKLERRADEIENFSQPHFELINDFKFNNNLNLNSTLFLIIGEGFFDYDGSWADTNYFRLTADNGFQAGGNPQNALIRAQVENTQFGWIPRLNLDHENGNLIFGAELRNHKSTHWGSINYGGNLPAGLTKDFRYYYYNGSKNIINGFINETYQLNDQFSLFGEFQLAYHQYRLYNEKYISTDFKISNIFFNSRLGVNYKITEEYMLHGSFARVSREPRLKNYYDAAESSGGEVPQFEKNLDGSYDFNTPYVKPETMNDFELGGYLQNDLISISVNIFYMLFQNEIVKNGKLDRFGQPVTGNIESTIHKGIEISVLLKPFDGFELYSNATLSKNLIKEGKYYVDGQTSINLSENRIGGFPDFLANIILTYRKSNLYLKLSGKYAGDFYSDNFDDRIPEYLLATPGFIDYSDNVNDSYFTADFYTGYEFNMFDSLGPSKIFLQVNNIFNSFYSAYAIGKEFFPAAERNYLMGVKIGL